MTNFFSHDNAPCKGNISHSKYDLKQSYSPKHSHSQLIFSQESEQKTPILSIQVLNPPDIDISHKEQDLLYHLGWYETGGLDSYARCGSIAMALGCVEHGHDKLLIPYSCGRKGCPTCYDSTLDNLARSASDKLKQGRNAYWEAGMRRKIDHFIISPPESDHKKILQMIEQGRYNIFKRTALAMAKKAGITGGCIVFHLYRARNKKDDVSFDDLMSDERIFSPHFHIVGIADKLMQSNKFFLETGWIYKTLGKRQSLERTVKYMLLNATHHGKYNTLSWFGLYSSNKLLIDHIKEEIITIPCSKCNNPLHKFELDYSWEKVDTLEPLWDMSLGIYFVKLKTKYYKIRNEVKS